MNMTSLKVGNTVVTAATVELRGSGNISMWPNTYNNSITVRGDNKTNLKVGNTAITAATVELRGAGNISMWPSTYDNSITVRGDNKTNLKVGNTAITAATVELKSTGNIQLIPDAQRNSITIADNGERVASNLKVGNTVLTAATAIELKAGNNISFVPDMAENSITVSAGAAQQRELVTRIYKNNVIAPLIVPIVGDFNISTDVYKKTETGNYQKAVHGVDYQIILNEENIMEVQLLTSGNFQILY